MRRFFIPLSQIEGDQAWINGKDMHHLVDVLRKGPEDEFEATDGQGSRLRVRIVEVSTDRLTLHVLERLSQTGATSPIIVYQAIPRGSNMELIVEKLSELGIEGLVPVMTERTVPRYEGERASKKQERWQKISLETTKKMGRAGLTTIHQPVTFKEGLTKLQPGSLRILPWELEEEVTLKQVLQSQKTSPIEIFIGPEGGFSLSEVDFLKNLDFQTVSLGSRILTVETASITTVACIQYEREI